MQTSTNEEPTGQRDAPHPFVLAVAVPQRPAFAIPQQPPSPDRSNTLLSFRSEAKESASPCVSSSMLTLQPVEPNSPAVAEAITLFTHYREFLTTAAATHCFDFDRFHHETVTLPTPYTASGGELLLARVDATPAACIAYRTAAGEPAGTCELKRLFVLPNYRGQKIARTLIAEALSRARTRGFTRAVLDTDAASMAPALAAYRALGFSEYKPAAGSIHYLELAL